jgi:hypothetical protein
VGLLLFSLQIFEPIVFSTILFNFLTFLIY